LYPPKSIARKWANTAKGRINKQSQWIWLMGKKKVRKKKKGSRVGALPGGG